MLARAPALLPRVADLKEDGGGDGCRRGAELAVDKANVRCCVVDPEPDADLGEVSICTVSSGRRIIDFGLSVGALFHIDVPHSGSLSESDTLKDRTEALSAEDDEGSAVEALLSNCRGGMRVAKPSGGWGISVEVSEAEWGKSESSQRRSSGLSVEPSSE